jgi:NAD(P) transhydrogenase subunit beta
MSANFAALFYLVAGVLFIMSLRGLSSPESSRQGNMYGMIGMAIAVVTTLFLTNLTMGSILLILLGIGIGGGIGAVIAKRIPMTAMPQLVAAFHSLVGLAAVLVAAAALYAPQAFGIGEIGSLKAVALIEMALGAAIGAITFTGSIIAFAKLDGRMSGKPIMLPARHMINIGLAVALVVLCTALVMTESHVVFWLIVIAALVLGVLDHHPDWRRGYAGGRLDAQLLFRLGSSRHRFHARQHGADHHRCAGRFVRCHPLLHHV